MFEESWTSPSGTEVIRTLSHDQFRDRYLATLIDSGTGTMAILAGTWDEQGGLVLDSVATETPMLLFGSTIYERMRIYDFEDDSFKMERENSVDAGETWTVMQKLAYGRSTGADTTQPE